jgi:AraC-like DNA-binding protein
MLHISLFSAVILLGSVQAIALTVILFRSKETSFFRHKYLAWFMLLFAYNSIETFLFSINSPLQAYTLNRVAPLFHLFCIGPLLLLYIRDNTVFKEVRPEWRYFLPAIVCFFANFISFVIIETKVLGDRVFSGFFTGYLHLLQAERLVMVAVFAWFLFMSFKTLSRWKIQATDEDTGEENKIIYHWLNRLLIVLLILWLIWGGTIFGSILFGQEFSMQFYIPLEISLSLAVYWIAFVGQQRIRIVRIEKQKTVQQVTELLDEAQLEITVKKLREAMTLEKHYLNPELNLRLLSEVTGINTRLISAVCNQVFQKGLGEFVNEYRIEEAKRRLSSSEHSHLTIAAIAYDSGFNSLPTFQRAFRQVTGLTPKEFQNSL